MKLRREPTSLGLDELLAKDPFRFTRSDADLKRLEHDARRDSATPYVVLLRALLGVGESFAEAEARRLWKAIVTHRKVLSAGIGRPMPLRAAAIDWLYLRDEEDRPIRPLLVSRQTLSNVVEEGRRDALTGLIRKAHFESALSLELRASREVCGSVVFIDLDGFKVANDNLGHAAGDVILRRFAEVARGVLRRGDLVGRIGGDEFALALLGLKLRTARAIVERLRVAFEKRCASEDVSFSYGITSLRRDDSPRAALARADAAMYRQKRRRQSARATTSASRSRSSRSARSERSR